MEPDAPAEPRRRGRKPSGTAKSSTERNKDRRERLARAGGRMLSGTMLDPLAAAALEQLTRGGATIDQAISAALVAHAAAVRARGGGAG